MIRKLGRVVAVAVLGALALVGPASAATTIRADPGAGLLTGSTTVTGAFADHYISLSDSGVWECEQTSFDINLNGVSSATSITGTVTAFGLSSCNGFWGLVNPGGCTLNPGSGHPVVHISSVPGGGLVSIDDITLRCPGMMGLSCYYTSTAAVGTVRNVPSTLAFSDIAFVRVGRSDSLGVVCGNPSTATWKLTHFIQGGVAGRTITVTTS